jgi:two-component system nitrate/nitrite response regulator NarL
MCGKLQRGGRSRRLTRVRGGMAMPGDGPERVVVADDHAFFRDGLSRRLVRNGPMQVVAGAANGREALDAIRRELPDVALVDYQMPDIDGVAVVHAVSATSSPPGLCCCQRTPTAQSCSVDAVLAVARGGTVVPADLAAGIAGEIRLRASSSGSVLTEREVLHALARGLSIPEVVAELFLGASTVKTHTQRLHEKLGVSDRAAAVADGMRRGLLE